MAALWPQLCAATPGSFLERTELIGYRFGSALSDSVREASHESYELSDGTRIDMTRWYGGVWTDLGLTFLTRLGPDLGITWGLSTGQRGEKYAIAPALTLGVLRIFDLAEGQTLSLSASTVLGGGLTEKPCLADYGAIGGVQPVNCRLAASPLPPEDTLRYLFDEPGPGRIEISIRYTWAF